MSSYPPNGTHVDVTIIDWVLTDGCTHSLLAVDDEERTYIHWLPDDKRWDSSWKKYVGEINLKAIMRCGRKEGPRGLTAYMVDIVLPKPERQPAPDVEGGKKLDSIVESIERHAPKPLRSRQVKFEPAEVIFLEQLAAKNNCSLKDAAAKCVRMAMAYDA